MQNGGSGANPADRTPRVLSSVEMKCSTQDLCPLHIQRPCAWPVTSLRHQCQQLILPSCLCNVAVGPQAAAPRTNGSHNDALQIPKQRRNVKGGLCCMADLHLQAPHARAASHDGLVGHPIFYCSSISLHGQRGASRSENQKQPSAESTKNLNSKMQ